MRGGGEEEEEVGREGKELFSCCCWWEESSPFAEEEEEEEEARGDEIEDAIEDGRSSGGGGGRTTGGDGVERNSDSDNEALDKWETLCEIVLEGDIGNWRVIKGDEGIKGDFKRKLERAREYKDFAKRVNTAPFIN